MPLLDKMKAIKQKSIDFIEANKLKFKIKEDNSKQSKQSKNPIGAYKNSQYTKSINDK